MDKKVNCQKICAALLSHNRHRVFKWPIVQEIHFEWANLNSKFPYLFATMVNRYSLTQPQRHRGTEAITAAWPYPYNSAKSHQAQLALDAAE